MHRTSDSASTLLPTAATGGQSMNKTMSSLALVPTNVPQSHKTIINALVNRLRVKLPCNSGLNLHAVESDPALQQAVELLIQLSRTQLHTVAYALSGLLDKVTKNASAVSDGFLPLDILHSQFYILKILSAALSFRTQIYRDSRRDPTSPQLSSSRHEPAFAFDALPLGDEVAQYTLSVMVLIMRQTSSVSERPRTIGLMYNEYVPDFHTIDAVGLTTISPSVTVSGSTTGGGTTKPEGSAGRSTVASSFRELDAASPSWATPGAASIPSLPSSAYPFASGMHGPSKPVKATGPTLNTTPALTSLVAPAAACYSDTPSSLSWLVYRYAARVAYAISSSNWDAVFSRVRGWIRTASASAGGGGADDSADTMDIRLLTCSAVNSARLSTVLSEKSSLVMGVKDKSKIIIANAVKQAVWNWIEILPNEYTEVLTGQRTLDNAPERLFDVLYSQSERDGKQRSYWPTLTVLLAASPERLKGLEILGTGGRVKRDRKVTAFREALIKGAQSGSRQHREAAISCLVDLSRAASYAGGRLSSSLTDSLPIKGIAHDMMEEVKNRLFNPPAPHKSFTEQNDVIDVSFHVDSLVAIFRCFPRFAVTTAFPAVLAPECSEAVKLVGVRSLLLLASEVTRVPSQPPLDDLINATAVRLRKIMISTTEQIGEQYSDGTGITPRLYPVAQRNAPDLPDRDQLILAQLALFRTDVRFFFTLRPSVASDIPRCVKDALLLLRPPFDPWEDRTSRLEQLTDASQDGLMEWQNLTMFLATWGGSCVCNETRYPAFRDLVQSDDIPKRMLWPASASKKVEEFIVRMVELLMSTHLFCRETVKDALGQELHPRLYSMLMGRFLASAKDKLGREAPWGSELSQFVEQAVTVLRLIFERIESETDTSHIKVSISALVRAILQILHAAPKDDSWGMRIRVKFCQMTYNLFEKRDYLALEQELMLRGQLLEAFAEWAMVELPPNTPDAQHRTQGEVNAACLKTVVLLLDRFQLSTPDSNQGISDDDVLNVRSRLFYRYFQFFLRVVKQCFEKNGDKAEVKIDQDPEDKEKAKEKDKYEESVIRRKKRFEITDRKCEGQVQPSRLCEIVRGPDIMIAMAMCNVCPSGEIDNLIHVILNIFDTRKSLLRLLKALIDREVAQTSGESNLFRSNSMCMRVLSAFARMHGYNYLRQILSPLISQMVAMPADRSYELDPKRPDGKNVEENAKSLSIIAQAFLNVICDSAPILPPILREVCNHIADAVNEIWPESSFPAVGSFMFLRFICPAIVSPESVDIELPRDNSRIKRGLMLITKIIQNLANNVLFGKEPYLIPLNNLLEANIVPLARFLNEVIHYQPPPEEEELEEWLGMTHDEVDQMVLHRYFSDNVDKIGKDLLIASRPGSSQANDTVAGKRQWDKLVNVLVELGQPAEVPVLSRSTVEDHLLYKPFMRSQAHRNPDASIREMFIQAPGAKSGTQVMNVRHQSNPAVPLEHRSQISIEETANVYIFRIAQLNVETVEFQLLLYRIFSLIGSNTAPFDLILDCTAFSATSEIPTQWINEFVEVTPFDFVERLRTIYIVNPNQLAQKFLRKMYHRFSGMGFGKAVVAVSAMAELIEKIHPDSLAPLTAASSLEREVLQTFSNVYQYSPQRMRSPITISVATTHIRITSGRPIAIYPGLNCKLTDTIFLRDIDDVYNVAAGREAGEFVIRRHDGGRTMLFASRDREEIAIRTSKNNLNTEGKYGGRDHFPHLGDISATLMNVALLNLGAENEQLRSGAYELLCSVCHYLEYKDFRLVTSRGFFIPANNSAFAAYFSDKLASHAPHLTLDFLNEFAIGFNKATAAQQVASLNYLHPWVSNLTLFLDPASPLFDPSSGKVRLCIRTLIDMTVKNAEFYPLVNKLVWENLGRANSGTVNATLDELTRSAIDGGLGSTRCELIAEALVNMSSVEVKGKLLARLRRAITRIKNPPPASPADDIAWNEVAAITRLVYMVLQNNRPPVQILIYIPEIFYLVTVLSMAGPLLLRKTVYGILVNVVQAFLTNKHTDDETKDNLRRLLNQTMDPEFQTVLGITRPDTRSEFIVVDPQSDSVAMLKLEELTSYSLEIIACGASSIGLANTWRGRWMGLLTSTAFQLSPYVQSRAFVVLGRLLEIPNTDLDDDLFYQMLVAFQSALAAANEEDPAPLLSMLRCLSKAVARLPAESRYLAQIAWIAIALIQSGYAALFSEAAGLLEATLLALEKYNVFGQRTITACLKEYRSEALDEIYQQLDELHSLSYASEATFSFSLASIISRGLRLAPTCAPAVSLLKTLLRISRDAKGPSPGPRDTLHTDRIGYFLALLSQATTSTDYAQLLELAGLDPDWLPPADADDLEKSGAPPEIDIRLFGEMSNETVLLVSSFAVTMINCSQSEIERQILFGLVSEAVMVHPEIVAIACESMLDRINDAFCNSPNPAILHAVSTIFRLTLSDRMWTNEQPPSNVTSPHSASTSTLGTNGDASAIGNVQNGSQTHDYALGELKMRGIMAANFLVSNRGLSTKLLNFCAQLVGKIIS
ncbi:Ras GTPase activating protein ira2 [Ceratobasidium sp. 423]|nr:Ras GTPase activating protein ira2 [Ceratobasidium sp. 423]